MGRLVDIEDVKALINGLDSLPWEEEVDGLVKTIPTAYDVEKVVTELEHFAKLAEDRWANGTSNHAYQEHKCWVKAIDIVKRGVVE